MAVVGAKFGHIDIYVEANRKESDVGEDSDAADNAEDDGGIGVHEQQGEEDDDPDYDPPHGSDSTNAYSTAEEEFGSENDNEEFIGGQRNKKKTWVKQDCLGKLPALEVRVTMTIQKIKWLLQTAPMMREKTT